MVRIAIVEDDRHDREALKKCLSRYEKENQVKFSLTEFQDGEDIVTDYTASYDLIILDIEMAFLNGMKAAEKIRELDTNVIIIFITNMPQYAFRGTRSMRWTIFSSPFPTSLFPRAWQGRCPR